MQHAQGFILSAEPGAILHAPAICGPFREREAFAAHRRSTQAIVLVGRIVAKMPPVERMVDLRSHQLDARERTAPATVDDALLAAFDDVQDLAQMSVA